MHLPITALTLAFCAILTIILGLYIVRLRLRNRIGLGTKGNPHLEIAMRAHANLIEQASMTILLLLVAEIQRLDATWLQVAAIVFCLSRCLHAYGFIAAKGGASKSRFAGTLFAWSTMIGLSIANAIEAFNQPSLF